MIARVRDWTSLTTDRLLLRVPTADDVDELFTLHHDPASWRHYPSLRHTAREQSAAVVEAVRRRWDEDGLGAWVLRARTDEAGVPAGALVGLGGCSTLRGPAWNLGYRLAPLSWGRGLAQELIDAARRAAQEVGPDLPVVARLLEHNTASRRAAERAGLALVWRGPDTGNPDPDAVRLVLADRSVPDDVLTALADT
jgi:RimJ/RimL family protein N-acetyltransferase